MKSRALPVALTTLILVCFSAYAGTQHEHPADQKKDDAGSMAERCRVMMDHMQAMRQTMADMDQRLQHKADAMNEATGDAKVAAMADVINELVSQRTWMHANMMPMHQQMMTHLAQHMAQCMDAQTGKAMTGCPMMKMMEGASEDRMHEGMGDRRGESGEDDRPGHMGDGGHDHMHGND